MKNDEEEIRLLRNEYARNWRKSNPDKAKEILRRFYKRQREKKQQEKRKDD